jgi:hypothetical protein
MKTAHRYTVTEPEGGCRSIEITEARTAWALDELLAAGSEGCTPLTTPGPRWSSYVHKLRHRHGLDVRTITEQHTGEFAGHHARYVLASKVAKAAEMTRPQIVPGPPSSMTPADRGCCNELPR